MKDPAFMRDLYTCIPFILYKVLSLKYLLHSLVLTILLVYKMLLVSRVL